MERVWWKIEGDARIEMADAAENDGSGGKQDSAPERDGDLSDGTDFPVEKRDCHHAQSDCDELQSAVELHIGGVRPKIAKVLLETNEPGPDLERAAENELPDEQKGHEASPFFAAVAVAQ